MKAYLIIENKLPTVHKDEKEAFHYVTFVRNTDKYHKTLKAMYCLFKPKDLKEGFCNCIFKSI